MTSFKEIFNDVYCIELDYHKDNRGYFSEIYKDEYFLKSKKVINFIQDNISFSKNKNTIRGLHFQDSPYEQSKYVTVLKGGIWDVFIDLRKDSKTYMDYGYIELYEGKSSLLIPKGFAHGFCTLEPDTLVLYKVDNQYSKDHENGIRWNDKALKIPWPKMKEKVTISDKDRNLSVLKNYNE